MNIDINTVVREYEQTIRELSVRLANHAIEKAALQAKIVELQKQKEEKKE